MPRGGLAEQGPGDERAGRIQPPATPFNANGYFFDAVVRHPVTVA